MVPTNEEQEILDAALQAEQQVQLDQQQKQQQQQDNLMKAVALAAAIVSPQVANAAANPSNQLTPAPMMALLTQLNPQLQQGLGQLVNDINQWNARFGTTPMNQLPAAAINSHPLMQPNYQNMIQGLSTLGQSANLSPALQAGLKQFSQLLSGLKPSSTAQSLTNSSALAAGVSVLAPAAAPLVNAGAIMLNKLASIMNPAVAQQQAPGAQQTNKGPISKLAQILKDSMSMKPGGK